MILTLIFAAVILIGTILTIIGWNTYGEISDDVMVLGVTLFTCFGVILMVCGILIGIEHSDGAEDKAIKLNQMKYESLLEEKELAESSTHDDIGRIMVTKDILEWNQNVYKHKRAVERKWINWFYSKRVVDELHYIDMSWE